MTTTHEHPSPDVPMPGEPQFLYGGYIFDLDGTIYLGDSLLPGVEDTLARLRELSIPVRFVSNNPTKNVDQYEAKLRGLGLQVERSEIVNTIATTVGWLEENHPSSVLFPIAEAPLVQALEQAGFEISDDPQRINVVIASYDRSFDYRKLQIAFDALRRSSDVIMVQTNPDRYCPLPDGRGEPDCAAVVAAIEACTGVESSANFGKPDPFMVSYAMATVDVAPEDMAMVGDRLATDIAMGRSAGMGSILVLTGDSSEHDVAVADAADRPDHVVRTLDCIIPAEISAGEGAVA